ncbi:MAG: type II toxin-antitoxin system Phd/YefM family antitoxin [Kiritimatiellia bacterium]|jgi:prevent-host-death family protein|nr:type II toxin-antitoxin system Phd/YefM family antitoxin [Kiritimatiellia bacterium]
MIAITFTEFRNRASDMLNAVEQGKTLTILRHGRPIAEVIPVRDQQPSWKRPALRLAVKGAGLAATIAEEREDEVVP